VTQIDNSTHLGLGAASVTPQLTIEVRSAIGYGPTELAAFDDALHATNISNFNLIVLSSVIPPRTLVTTESTAVSTRPDGEWGDRLYVVMAEKSSAVAGEHVAAGIGWVQEPDTGKGLFVEHEGHDACAVDQDISASLNAMARARSESFGPIRQHIMSATTPPGSAVCALVVATYESQPWTSAGSEKNRPFN